MDELIIVDRQDGRAVAGLLTALLAHWDGIPLGVQAAIIEHASVTAFDSVGRPDGRYAVTAFILRHRAAMARRARRRSDLRGRVRQAVDIWAGRSRRMGDAAARWPLPRWLASFRKAA